MDASREESRIPAAALFAVIFTVLFITHFPLLRLPYFWDEAGYYVPAARDLWLNGSLIPLSTPSNAHPPLVMAYLALCWRIAGYSPLVTRTAMLAVAAVALFGIYRLAQRIANTEVAIASTACVAIYPVFFSQSSMAHVDLAAAAFIFWGLLAYVSERRISTAAWFCLAALAKETAILIPAALFAWEVVRPFVIHGKRRPDWKSAGLLFSALPLALWYAYHYLQTGYVFGNPEFFRYNVQGTLQPLRILLALLMRIWQSIGYMSLYVLTAATVLAMWSPARRQAGESPAQPCAGTPARRERPRISVEIQLAFLAVTVVYTLAMAVIGGAVLARYMLPIVPLVIMVWISTLWRRVEMWKAVVVIAGAAFAISLFVNPPYGFSIEDNLAYRDYIALHQRAEGFLEARYPMARVLTAWPANDELARPTLGYVTRPMRVLRIEDFTAEQLMSAADLRSHFDIALVFSTKYEPRHSLLEEWSAWQRIKSQFFGYHRDVPPLGAAQILGGDIVYSESRNGQWIAVIEIQEIIEAGVR
jgi:dolichyl-phosphate-mannose-protein mannosyltransferase